MNRSLTLLIDLAEIDSGETPMIPWQVDPNWYQRYWLEEHPGSAQALIWIAAKRILRLFRPMRNGGSASVDAASAIVTRPHRSVMPWSLRPRMSRIKLSAYWPV